MSLQDGCLCTDFKQDSSKDDHTSCNYVHLYHVVHCHVELLLVRTENYTGFVFTVSPSCDVPGKIAISSGGACLASDNIISFRPLGFL